MMTRISITTLVCAASLAGTAVAQNRPQNPPPAQQPAAAPGQGQRPAAQEGPKPYRDVITAQAVTDSGVFHVHRIGEKLYYEIPRAGFGREFLLVADQRGTARGVGYAGEEVTSRVVRWERLGNRVLLRLVNYDMTADSTLPVSRAVRLSNVFQVLRSFDVAAFSPEDSNAVIEVTGLFTQDVPEINARQALGRRVRRFDPSRSVIERARSFPRNIEVSATQTYEVDSLPGAPGQRADGSINTVTVLMNYSMVLLPDEPMRPRLCDSRFGIFGMNFEDFGRPDVRARRRCYLVRWRLEPSEPSAAASPPLKPIVWYVDPATPEQWVPWLIRGVEMWEPVFRAAGFPNAIMARRAPTPTEDPEFDVDDARYTVVRWLPSTIENAYGPATVDPRSGEILQSNIGFYHNITSLLQAWYWTQAGAADPRAQRLPFPDTLMGQMVAYVMAHEVGHTLGMPHLMKSSAMYPVDSLRSRTYTCTHGTSYSIMDYARNNYVAQPGDNACLQATIGTMDYYTINFGYRRVPGAATPEAERVFIDSLARLQETHPEWRYGRQGDPTDPRVVTEALGDDPVRAGTFGVANLRRLMPMLIPATTTNRLDDFDLLNDMYGDLIAQWAREMGHVAVVVGGVYRDDRYAGQTGYVFTPVPRERQAAAVTFLLENVFTTPTWLLDPEVLRRIEPTGSVNRVRVQQVGTLGALLQDARLARLAESAAAATDPASAYTIAELFGTLRRGIYSEAAAPRPMVDTYRRNLQQVFVDQMERLISTPLAPTIPPGALFPGQTPPLPRPYDARALARAELRDLYAQLRTALIRTTDRTTRAHFEDVRDRIDRVLNPR